MIKKFIFTLGLPGSGKSTYINENYTNVFDFTEYLSYSVKSLSSMKMKEIVKEACNNLQSLDTYLSNIRALYHSEGKFPFSSNMVFVVSADDIKKHLDGFSMNNPQLVHEESVQLAKQLVYLFAQTHAMDVDILMDGGAINNHYTMDIITELKGINFDTKIVEIFFDTPVEVCIKRIEQRQRKVPIESIYDKNLKIVPCLNKYKTVIDDFIKVPYFTNKYILLDMDGTIASYTSNIRYDINDNADFVNGEAFLHLRPVKYVIDFVKKYYDMNNVYICSAVANNIVWDEKNKWLDKYFPEIPKQNRLFVGNKDWKWVFVKQFAEHQGWKQNEVTLVDDLHSTIKKCKANGINCIHPSNIEAIIDPYAILG